MAVTTWTFPDNFEAWTFTDTSNAGSSATRSHVSGAIRTTISVAFSAAKIGRGEHFSPTLNAAIANGDTIEADHGAASDAVVVAYFLIATYTDTTTESTSQTTAGSGTLTLTLTQNKTLDFITYTCGRSTGGGGGPHNFTTDLEEVRLTTVTPFVGTGERPLELDVDLAGGDKIWATKWKDGGLFLTEHSSALVLQNTFAIATGTTSSIVQIDNRTFYMTPYAPPFFGTASLDDIIYIFGRWDDGGVAHLEKSVNGGSTFSDIGDSGTWGTGWVGGFFADDANTLFAFVNGASRALYRSTNAGSSWTNLSTLPFDVDPGGVSKHPDGRILISNRDAGSATAAFAEPPDYPAWFDATGAPSFPTSTPGAGSNAIIWIT